MKKFKELSRALWIIFVVAMFAWMARAAQYVINPGPFIDSGVGDNSWTMIHKVNSNFTELYGLVGGESGGIGGTNTVTFVTSTNGYDLTIESFGGIGDGATDNFGAMTNAVLTTSGAGGGTILFGPKTYRISTTMPFSNLKSIRFLGQGKGRTIIELNVFGGTTPGFSFTSTTNWDGITFENMTIAGVSDSDVTPWDLIVFGDRWSNGSFLNCELKNAIHSAIRWTATTYGTNWLIDNCWVHGVSTTNMTAQAGGAIMGSPNNLNIRNTTVDMFGVTNRSVTHAIYLSALTNFSVVGCSMNGINGRLHVYGGIGASRNGVSIGNRFKDVPSITLADVNGMIFSQTVMDNSSMKFSCDNGIVSGNIVNSGTIQVLSAANQTFSGNLFSNLTGTAMFTIDSGQSVVIKGNSGYSGDGININAGAGHLIENNAVRISSAIDGCLHLTGTTSNVISRANYYYAAGATPFILKNEGTGTNCWSYYDTFDSVAPQTSGFNAPKYPTGVAYP